MAVNKISTQRLYFVKNHGTVFDITAVPKDFGENKSKQKSRECVI